MNIENQVCTLEQSKRLKQLGITQDESIFFYCNRAELPTEIYTLVYRYDSNIGSIFTAFSDLLAAFTVAELGVMCHDENDLIVFECYYSNHLDAWMWQILEQIDPDEVTGDGNCINWRVAYSDSAEYDTEAEAKAAMLIYAIEKNLLVTTNFIPISVAEINKRLSLTQ